MKCKKCKGTGWIITKGRLPMTNYTQQTRCDCGIWVKEGLKWRKKENE